jgi:predicted nucleotidyltransferase
MRLFGDIKMPEVEKMKIVKRFTSELFQRIQKDIYGIYLFGSLAKGTVHPGSDIDLLIIYSNKGESHKIADVIDEICFTLACQLNEAPEVILISEDEYKREVGRSPFLWEVLNFGKPIFIKEEATEQGLF